MTVSVPGGRLGPVTAAASSSTVVPLPQERRAELLDIDTWAFAGGVDDELVTLGLEWDRTAGAEVDGRLAGVYSVYSLATSVPGGSLPTAGLTWVGVHPQFRRRGVLSSMIRHHLDTVRERGTEPISSLWAAEPAIYGRFGYGAATTGVRLTLPRAAAMVDVAGTGELHVRFEPADPAVFADVVDACHAEAAASRPGVVTRGSADLRRRVLEDRPTHRGHAAEPLRLLLVEDIAGQVRGYAIFSRTSTWTDGGPAGTVKVAEAVALDAAASRLLWGRLADLDLMSSVETDSRAHDDALLHQLVDLRATAPKVTDGTWVRIIDVGAAFSGRVYSTDVDVVLEVEDAWCPWNAGRWRLTGGPEGATCVRTDDDADLGVGAAALGSALLGGCSLLTLHGAGLLQAHDDQMLVRASQALAWHVAPHCGWVF